MGQTGVAGPGSFEAARWWGRMARDPMATYVGLSRRYGDAVRVPFGLGRRSFFLLSRPEHAERVLVANQDNYVKAFTYRPLRVVLGDGLLTSEGEMWRRHRRVVQPVFSHRHVAGFAPHMVETTERVVRRWPDGVALDAAGELRKLTLGIVGSALFGRELSGEAGRTGRSLEALQRGAVIGTFLPGAMARRSLYQRVPGLGAALLHLDDMVQRVVRGEDGGELLNLLKESGEFGEEELRDEVLTLLLAGHETTAASLAWTFILLSRYPAARERLEREVDEVIGGREPKAEDADELPWTKAVLSEAMRLYPPAWTIERDAVDDDEVGDVPIPAGATLAVPPYLIHRNADIWPNPEGFEPERFMGEQRRPRYAYLPFGGGRRICVGAGFAMLEATLVLATISRTHRLDLVPGRAAVTFRPAGPVPMRVVRR
jgi:cytochrome P450